MYYFGHVHEELRSDSLSLNYIINEKIVIEHNGYAKEVVKSKRKPERNIKLLGKTIQEEPCNPRWIYFLFRDGYEIFDAEYSIRMIKETLSLAEENRIGNYKTGLIDLIVRYQLKRLCSEEEFEQALCLLDSVEPNNTNTIFYRAVFKLSTWKLKAKETLDNLIEYREKNQADMPEMIHSQGLHLDGAIAIYLFECGYYKQAEKMFRFLFERNYQTDLMDHHFSLFKEKKEL